MVLAVVDTTKKAHTSSLVDSAFPSITAFSSPNPTPLALPNLPHMQPQALAVWMAFSRPEQSELRERGHITLLVHALILWYEGEKKNRRENPK